MLRHGTRQGRVREGRATGDRTKQRARRSCRQLLLGAVWEPELRMEPGTILKDRFRIEEHLERTHRGERYAAVDLRTQTPCRVEVLCVSGFAGQEELGQAQREVLLGQRLAGVPNLVRTLDCGLVAPDRLFVAREAVVGERALDLRGTPDEVAWRLLAAARCVEAVAQLEVVHRDLSPLTLRSLANDGVALGGWRLARAPRLPEPLADPRGLPFSWLPCAAPECLRAPEEADARADVYSLGALLYLALTGAPPYPGPTLVEIVLQQEAVRRGEGPPPTDAEQSAEIPSGLRLILSQALQLEPSRRLPSAAAFAEFLEDWLSVRETERGRGVEDEPAEETDLLSSSQVAALAELGSSSLERTAPPPASSNPMAVGKNGGPRTGAEDTAEDEPVPLSPEEAAAFLSAREDDGDPLRRTSVLPALELPEPAREAPSLGHRTAAAPAGERVPPSPTPRAPAPPPAGSDFLEAEPLPPSEGLLEPDPLPPAEGLLEPEPLPPAGGLPEPEPTEGPGGTATLPAAELPSEARSADPFASEEELGGGDAELSLESGELLGAGTGLDLSPPLSPEPLEVPDLGSLDLTDASPAAELPAAAPATPPSGPALEPPPATPPPLPLEAAPDAPQPPPPEEAVEEPPAELLPPVAFERLEAHGDALLLRAPCDLDSVVGDLRRLDAQGFAYLLLDMREVPHLGGKELEALTEVAALAARRGLRSGMFGLRADVRQLLEIMDMGDVLPPLLRAGDDAAALAAVRD
ncbi:MAG: hypothetical protein D6731_15930 [Planctomycetota bacterium]|nr:MAG: hypothetical protein D6731_15930 [Planctomycetota bacterium]